MATGLRNYWDKVKRYYPFNKDEKKALLITTVVLAFIIGFNDGSSQFNLSKWLLHFIFIFIGVGISVLFHESGHRLVAFPAGFKVEYQLWWYGLVIGIIFALFSKGNIWILVPGGIWAHHMLIHRLGFFRYGPNTFAISVIALSGPLASIICATLIKTIQWIFFSAGSPFLQKLFIFNLAYAVWSLIPIPPLDGSKVFFHSRLTFAFIFGCVLGYTVLAAFGIFSWILALIIGGLIWLVYYVYFEVGAWVKY
tara:strand:+ start:1684 stop:2439 length:756 start_codon:yes stop_codon:yes gene_type:complete